VLEEVLSLGRLVHVRNREEKSQVRVEIVSGGERSNTGSRRSDKWRAQTEDDLEPGHKRDVPSPATQPRRQCKEDPTQGGRSKSSILSQEDKGDTHTREVQIRLLSTRNEEESPDFLTRRKGVR